MASIATTEGSLYFLGDKDYLTGKLGPYVKIGIVRYDKPTKDRISEHQTGNPRQIIDLATVENIPFVEKIETLLHYHFNEKWITGEWFKLSEKELPAVIKMANSLKKEQIKFQEALAKREDLKSKKSNTTKIKSVGATTNLHKAWIKNKLELDKSTKELNLARSELVILAGNKGLIDGVLYISQTKASEGLDKTLLKKEHNDLYNKFVTVEPSNVTGSLKIEGKLKLKDHFPELEKAAKLIPKENWNKSHLNNTAPISKVLIKAHDKFRHHQKQVKLLDWELFLIESRLMEIVGTNLGIEGVCTWERKLGSKKVFNETLFAKKHPKIFNSYCRKKPGVFRCNIHSTRCYKK